MSILVLGIILVIILLFNIWREPRSFWNALYMLVALGVLFLGAMIKAGPALQAKIVIGCGIAVTGLALVIPVFLMANGVVMIKKEGRRLQNLLSLILGILILLGEIVTIYLLSQAKNPILLAITGLVILLEFYVAYTFTALLIYSGIYTYLPKRLNCDYIIVHGCGLLHGNQISPLLKGRVNKAVQIYQRCKQKPKLVVSGGMGSNETISEAQAMKTYLNEIGFSMEDVIMEDASKTTFENLQNVRDMLDTETTKHNYIFVTNNYHVFRTGLFARKLKMKARDVGCKTAGYYWPSAFIREYIAIMVKYIWIPIVITVLWVILMILYYM